MSTTSENLLERTWKVAHDVLAPNAREADRRPERLVANLASLAEQGLLGAAAPVQYGGFGADPAEVRRFLEILASACGVTNFVLMQHVQACSFIATSPNEHLKGEVLPLFTSGRRKCSVAYSHLRRPEPPMVRAREEEDTFVFEGTAPWMTGWGMMDEVVLGGTLEDGRLLYVLAQLESRPALHASEPMRFCAMDASATVTLTLTGLRVPRSRFLKTMTLGEMAAADSAGILRLTALSFGAARASIGLLREMAAARQNGLIGGTADALAAELDAARREVDEWELRSEEQAYPEQAVRLRAWAMELGVRAAHAAVAASGGAANSVDHPAQRLVREAMVYLLSAQTRGVQAEYLMRSTRASTAAWTPAAE